jgi:hypothetical protein
VDRFRDATGLDVVIDDHLTDSQFALDFDNGVAFISAFIGGPVRQFHRVLMDAALTLRFGPGPWAGTRQLPSLPRLIAVAGNLVDPKRSQRLR